MSTYSFWPGFPELSLLMNPFWVWSMLMFPKTVFQETHFGKHELTECIIAESRNWGSRVHAAAAAAKSLQSCLTPCDSIDGSPPGYPVPGILQARTLEWVAISFSNAWKWKMKVKLLSRVRLLATPWTVAHQAPLCMGFFRQGYWSRVPLPSPSRVHRVSQITDRVRVRLDFECKKRLIDYSVQPPHFER